MDAFWTLCLQHFEHSLPQQQFRTWIQPLRPRRNGKTLILEAPNRFVLQWVKDRFLPVIEQLARDHQGGTGIHLELAQRSGAGRGAPATASVPAVVPAPAAESRPRVR